MAKYITEVLKELNDNPELFKTTYKPNGDGGPLGLMFKFAFLPAGKFLLPDGEPPFKPAPEPLGMSPARFIQEIRKFKHFVRTDLSNTKREQLFIQMLESIHPTEAKILIAIKDQNLPKLYPNITRKVLADAGYLPPLTEEQVAEEATTVKKSKRVAKKSLQSDTPRVVL